MAYGLQLKFFASFMNEINLQSEYFQIFVSGYS